MASGYLVFFDFRVPFSLPLDENGTPVEQLMWICFTWLTPVTGFGLLLMSEVAAFLFGMVGPGKYRHLRHPVMAVHGSAMVYYVLESSSWARPFTDIFGRPFYPMRYALWTCSVTCMIVAIYLVVVDTLAQAKALPAFERALHQELAYAMLGAVGTFVAGGVGSSARWLHPSLLLLLLAASFGSFYVMLICISRMLGRAHRAAPRRVASQFLVVRAAVLLLWHVFPAVWALAACHVLTETQEHLAYIGADVLAKHLLLFVYNHNVV